MVCLWVLNGAGAWASISVDQSNGLSLHDVPSDVLLLSPSQWLAQPASAQSSTEGLSGPQKLLVLTVQFTDVAHSTASISSTVDELSKYWQDVSYGKISLSTTIATTWYTLKQTSAYYGTNPETSSRKIEFITDAVDSTGNDFNYADFSYVMIVHAGDSEGHSQKASDIWDVGTIGRGTVSTSSGSYELGVTIVAEKDPVGAWAHELGHNFGLPDLWDYQITNTKCSWCDDFVGEWDLMAHGCWSGNGETPAWLSSWSLLRLGWLDDSAVTTIKAGAKGQGMVRPLESADASVVKAVISDSTYYLVEARQKTGWDRNLPDSGMIVLYVDDTKGNGEGPVRVKGPSDSLDKAWKAGQFFIDKTNQLIIGGLSADANLNFQVAVYGTASTGTTYAITVDTPYPDLLVTLDGKDYKTGQTGQVVIQSIAFGPHNLTAPTVRMIDQGARSVFSGWGDHETENPRILVVVSDMNLTISYKMQYLLTMITEVPVTGGGWCDAGSQAVVRTDSFANYGNSTRRVFTGWSGDITGANLSSTVLMTGPKRVTAHWTLQYELNVTSQYGDPQGAGWYGKNETVTISITNPFPVETGTRARFAGWSGDITSSDSNATMRMDRPKLISASWQLQHEMTVTAIDANGVPVTTSHVAFIFDYSEKQAVLNETGQVWLDAGEYTLLSTWCHGVNVSVAGAKYATSPNGNWTMKLSIYSVTVNVRSIITTLPAKDATVKLTLPDHTILAAKTDEQGNVVFTQVPGGSSYPAAVTIQYLPQQFTIGVGSSNTIIPVKAPVPLELVVVAAVGVLAAAMLITKARRRQRSRQEARKRRAKHHQRPAIGSLREELNKL
jgi:M6 family metalloprotease-like protein